MIENQNKDPLGGVIVSETDPFQVKKDLFSGPYTHFDIESTVDLEIQNACAPLIPVMLPCGFLAVHHETDLC